MCTRLFLFLLLIAIPVFSNPTYKLEIVAGSPNVGDGQLATQAQLSDAQGLAVDRAGNIYIADPNNHRIRRVDPEGRIDTVAGTGVAGFSGDGGPAKSALLYAPYGIAVDGTGVLYIADYGNRRIRRVGLDGRIATVAGSGEPGSAGDGGPAISATLNGPRNVALDSAGNLYISDFDAHVIRRVDIQGVISTYAGNGQKGATGDGQSATAAQLNGPAGLFVDSSGTLFVADSGNGRVRKVSLGLISTFYNGDHTFTWVPTGIVFDTTGVAYIADAGGLRIVRVDPTGNVRIVAGTGGPLGSILLQTARDVAVDVSGNLLIADGMRVRKITPDGLASVVAGDGTFGFRGDGGRAVEAALQHPTAVAVASDGSLFIADTGNQRIRKVNADGNISTMAGNGSSTTPVVGRPALETPLFDPIGLTLDGNGALWFAEQSGHRIRLLTQTGVIATVAGTGQPGFDPDMLAVYSRINGPSYAMHDGSGNIFIADTLNHRVRKFSLGGTFATVAGTGAAGYSGDGGNAIQATLNLPSALALDSKGNLYIADSGNDRIRVVSPDGTIRTFAGSATPLSNPRGIAVAADGTVFVSDTGNHRILAFSGSEAREIAGRGVPGYGAPAQIATDSELNAPSGFAISAQGVLFVADQGNHRICKLTPNATTPPVDPSVDPPVTLSVLNAASLAAGPIAPGELIRIAGDAVGPAEMVSANFGSDGLLPLQINNIQALFDGVPARLLLVSGDAVHAQVPYAVAGKTSVTIEVTNKDKSVGKATADVVRAAPAIFTAEGGKGAALALNADGSMNATWNPAVRGTFVSFFATGEGLTTPDGLDGRPAAAPLPKPVLPVWVQIGGKPAEVIYAGSAPGMVGILQVNAKIASDLTPGPVPIVLAVGAAASQDEVFITIR